MAEIAGTTRLAWMDFLPLPNYTGGILQTNKLQLTLIHVQHIDLKSSTLVPFGTLPAQLTMNCIPSIQCRICLDWNFPAALSVDVHVAK